MGYVRKWHKKECGRKRNTKPQAEKGKAKKERQTAKAKTRNGKRLDRAQSVTATRAEAFRVVNAFVISDKADGLTRRIFTILP